MYVYMITCVGVSLTVNATSHNGLLCPEVAEWICNVSGIVAHFSLSNCSTECTISPYGVRQLLNIAYVLTSVDEGSYSIGTLIVNNEELHNLGYPLLTCGTFAVTTNYSLALDKEGKNKYVHICPFYLSDLQ